MATVQQVLDREFEILKDELIKEYDTLGMRASGKFADTAEVISTETNVKLVGENYSEQLEFGRKAGKFPPIQAIKQWITDKGIVGNIRGNISISSLAFLIARKISREGWKRQQHGGVELISKVITDAKIQKIIDLVGAELTLTLVDRIGKEIEAKIAV